VGRFNMNTFAFCVSFAGIAGLKGRYLRVIDPPTNDFIASPKQVASTTTRDVEEAISGTLGWTHEQDYEPDWAFPPPFSTD